MDRESSSGFSGTLALCERKMQTIKADHAFTACSPAIILVNLRYLFEEFSQHGSIGSAKR
jgi:hypothetical protein